jgi:hypothetical protein
MSSGMAAYQACRFITTADNISAILSFVLAYFSLMHFSFSNSASIVLQADDSSGARKKFASQRGHSSLCLYCAL